MGIYQKQASAYFHAKSGLTEIAGNGAHTARCACVDSMLKAVGLSVVFNGPRAMFNFNDDLLGGDNVHANLLANAVRESGDHSAINSCESRLHY